MSFKSYAIRSTIDDLITLDDPQPLVFSGRHGLIAKFVLSEKERAMNPWKLCVVRQEELDLPHELLIQQWRAQGIQSHFLVFEDHQSSSSANELDLLDRVAVVPSTCSLPELRETLQKFLW